MNVKVLNTRKHLIAAALTGLSLAACVTTTTRPEGADAARIRLTQLQSDPQLATRAPVAIHEADAAVRLAEEPRDDLALGGHLVYLANRKVDTAWAQAQARLAQDQLKTLADQREAARLEARTREAELARLDARSARSAAEIARSQASSAMSEAERARQQALSARTEAEIARSQADAAAMETEAARQRAGELERQLLVLNAKTTERGYVITLGDVLFQTGKAELKGGATSNLAQLANFLNDYRDRSVIIEGHTDSVGSDEYNRGLSQRRADAVKAYLVRQGIEPNRVITAGMGESAPVADNVSDTGRQQNRRVEVIISNTQTSSIR